MDLCLILGWKLKFQQQTVSASPQLTAAAETPEPRDFDVSVPPFWGFCCIRAKFGLCLGYVIFYTPNSRCQELSASDFWHQLFLKWFSPYPLCLRHFFSPFHLFFPCRSSFQPKLIQTWKVSDVGKQHSSYISVFVMILEVLRCSMSGCTDFIWFSRCVDQQEHFWYTCRSYISM